MKTIKKIAVFFAGAIIVLHTMTPHQHNSENKAAFFDQHEKTIFDYISLALHIDLGNHHLEDFLTSDIDTENLTNLAEFNLISTYLVQQVTFKSFKKKKKKVSNLPPTKDQYKTRTDQFRGPPSHS